MNCADCSAAANTGLLLCACEQASIQLFNSDINDNAVLNGQG
jgi:hypothetical protein